MSGGLGPGLSIFPFPSPSPSPSTIYHLSVSGSLFTLAHSLIYHSILHIWYLTRFQTGFLECSYDVSRYMMTTHCGRSLILWFSILHLRLFSFRLPDYLTTWLPDYLTIWRLWSWSASSCIFAFETEPLSTFFLTCYKSNYFLHHACTHSSLGSWRPLESRSSSIAFCWTTSVTRHAVRSTIQKKKEKSPDSRSWKVIHLHPVT